MYIDRSGISEFAYHGVFYRTGGGSPDGDLLGGQGYAEERVLETACDIQVGSKEFDTDVSKRQYTVYFPLGAAGLPKGLKPGIYFRSEMHGMAVGGMVTEVYPSQMGCTANISGTDV